MRLVNIGYGNMVALSRVVALVSADSVPARRMVQDAREDKRLIDGTAGHKGACVLVMDNGFVALSPLQTETVAARLQTEYEGEK